MYYTSIGKIWARLCDRSGNLILLGEEIAEQAQNALQELRDRLQAMGLDPDNLSNG